MKMSIICIDSSALVNYVREDLRTDKIDKVMEDVANDLSDGFMSVVNLAEFHRAITRMYSEEEADRYVAWLKESKIKLISLDIDIAIIASTKKQQYARARSPFAWGDAFCLATALRNNADVLITSDDEFDKVTDVRILKV